MTSQFEANTFAAPDAMSAVVYHVNNEYGHNGYIIGLAMSSRAVSVFEVRHSDGSTFNLVADMWGNVQRIPDNATQGEAEQIVKDMHREAVAS